MAAKRTLELWEILDGKLGEAQGWSANCLAVVSGWRGGNHPRQEEFLKRWCKLSAQIGVLRMDLEKLVEEQQGSGFPHEALRGLVQAECGPCNRKHGGGIRYKRKDKTRQGARRKGAPKEFYRQIGSKHHRDCDCSSCLPWTY